ncbi:MAG: SurA N-terminal domain-containing protein [Cyclobacteriaceae bacterium]|nr:SurA N-terminal domain-containing protein [Cyclobacteriaceae bacterium]
MALIGTLRNKMTKWVVGFVAVAIAAFVLNDLFGNGPRSVFAGSDNVVGEVAGKSISLEEFQAAVQARENNYILNFGRQPGEREMPTLRQQAWDLIVSRYAVIPQYEQVGVKVTTDEEWDIIQGKNVDQNIKLSFTDSAGNFDRSSLISYLQSLDDQPVNSEQRIRWNIFRADLVPSRERLKFENLILKTNYVTQAESEREYHLQNDVAEVKYLYVPYYSMSDSLVTASDSQLRDYYNKNKAKYKAEASRSLSYVSFPLIPSPTDSAEIKDELAKIAADFKTAEEDSIFATINSDNAEAFAKYTPDKLPTFLENQISSMTAGQVVGPLLDAGRYKVAKLVSVNKDTVYNARASHILIRWDDSTDAAKKVAKDKAQGILNQIKAGADFAGMASEHGSDGTASRGGDLGYFTSGQMVKPFENAVFNARSTGLINNLVETEFGYHIINVTSVKDNTSYTIATIEREITPSDETQNEAYRKADLFASSVSDLDEFKKQAAEENLTIYDAQDVGTRDSRVNTLDDARQIVLWLFRDASEGKVSDVFDVQDAYAVAVMTGETEEGVRPFDDVKEEITPLVKNELKGAKIIEKLKAISGTLDEIATAYGSDATVNSSSDLKLNTNSLPGVGIDPIAIGKAFAMESGKRSEPFAGENGVLILESQAKTIAPEVGDYSIFKNQKLQAINNKSGLDIAEALKKGANIEDKRYLFY